MKYIWAGLFFPWVLYAAIVTTNDVKPYLDLANDQTVVILDIVDTILEFKDVVIQKEYDSWKTL